MTKRPCSNPGIETAAPLVRGSGAQIASVSYAQAVNASCDTAVTSGKLMKSSCVFVLADGQRFSCRPRVARGGVDRKLAGALKVVPVGHAAAPELGCETGNCRDAIGAGVSDRA